MPRHVIEEGERREVIGPKLKKGQRVPDFTLKLIADDQISSKRILGDSSGNVHVFSLVNSLLTSICAEGTKELDNLCEKLPDNVQVFTISTDSPVDIADWVQMTGVKNHTFLSAEDYREFGVAFGAWVEDWEQLQRVLIVVGTDDTILRIEYVYDQMKHPNYSAAIKKAWDAAGS